MRSHAGQDTFAPVVKESDEDSEKGKGNEVDRLHVVESEEYPRDEQTFHSERAFECPLKISAEECLFADRRRDADDDDKPDKFCRCVGSENLFVDLCEEVGEVKLPHQKFADVTADRNEKDCGNDGEKYFKNRYAPELNII